MASSGIVREVLTRYNYGEWKTLMKSYLRGKNLWDVVVGSGSTSTPIDARRDAKALHIIQLSCGPEIFDQIKHFETAKIAWNHLAAVYSSEFKAQPHIRHGVTSDNVSEHKDLYEFVGKGDWKGASSYLRENHNAEFWAPASGRTVLHVATMEGHFKIVEGLVELGKARLVEMQDEDGYTALALAAGYSGDMDIAKCIVNGVGDEMGVLALPNNKGEIPLLLAADSGHKRMTRFLFFKTPSHVLEQQSSRNRVLLLERCIQAHIFDVALMMLNSYPELPIESLPYGFGALHQLARMPPGLLNAPNSKIVHYLTNGTSLDLALIFLRRTIILPMARTIILCMAGTLLSSKIKNITEQNFRDKEDVLQILMHYKDNVAKFSSSQLREASVYDAMLDAAKHGNVDFINAMGEANHDLLWAMDNHGRDIFSYAVLHRKENVFQLMHTRCVNKDINYRTDMFGNNLLHLAARLGPFSDLNVTPSAVLQMQREIQWFKAVEDVVHPKCREARNDEGKKPGEIFRETHQELMKDGEKWAKETAGTFAIIAVLVITVTFAAAITVPGGYNQETGVPIFINEKIFTLFIQFDITSLATSIVAVTLWIDIQTSRYGETNFLLSLPTKIMISLILVSFSLVCMMVALCAALAIVLKESREIQNISGQVAIMSNISLICLIQEQFRLIQTFPFLTSYNGISLRQLSAYQGSVGRIRRYLRLIIQRTNIS